MVEAVEEGEEGLAVVGAAEGAVVGEAVDPGTASVGEVEAADAVGPVEAEEDPGRAVVSFCNYSLYTTYY